MSDIRAINILLILAVLPSLFLGYYVYKNDKIEKEPTKLLIKLFLGGVLSAGLTIIISEVIVVLLPFLSDNANFGLVGLFFYSLIFVGLIEEGCKYLITIRITWNNKEFKHIYDAIVYCVFVSLGFATIENILYVLQNGIGVAILRAVLSVPGHAFFGIAMGIRYGLCKQASLLNDKKGENKNKVLALLVPFLLHGFFDYCLFSQEVVLVLIYLIFIIFLYINSYKNIKAVSNVRNNFLTNEKKDVYCYICGRKYIGDFCTGCGNKRE